MLYTTYKMIKNPLYTRKPGNKVAKAATVRNENVLHIIYGGTDTWKVIREGQDRSSPGRMDQG